MFLFKKMITPLFLPVPLCLEILIVGLVLLWFTQKQKFGKMVVTLGTLLLLVLGSQWFSDQLLGSVENPYAPLMSASSTSAKWIVVLGGGHTSDPKLPANAQLSDASRSRLIEGIRLWRTLPSATLVLSGGSAFDTASDAQLLAETARYMGVDPNAVMLEDRSRDTDDEARLLRPILRDDRFILVTSASHMRRALKLFESQGMHPIPAASDFHVKSSRDQNWLPSIFPSAGNLDKSERALYEILGVSWATFKSRL
ncbi:MAG TPA: envelope biogenesis factor ElyC [Acidobacteriota bacterium]|nr:envelope biogenesis factor ElyC [Acidobacteriota bacterium]